MRNSYLVFGQPLIEEAEIEEVVKSMRAAWLGTGPKVAEFERRVAAYKGVKYAVAVNSCTAGLHLACIAADLKPGDEVLVPAMTFAATINAVIHAGATPVLVDVDPQTFNMDPVLAAEKITDRTRAIMLVHFAGRACDMDAFEELAARNQLRIIEDCAHAIETEYRGRKVGTIGDFGVLSFYSTKNIITGEGGMVLTNDAALAERIKVLALHGMSSDAWRRFSDTGFKHYDVVEIGYKYNMMDLQAAIGMHQIERVDAYWERRHAIWNQYSSAFAALPLDLPAALEVSNRHAFHLYTVLIDEASAGISRDRFLSALQAENIGAGVHYRAIPEHPVYQRLFGWKPSDYPNAKRIGERTVSLPLSARLSDTDVNDVIASVRNVLGR